MVSSLHYIDKNSDRIKFHYLRDILRMESMMVNEILGKLISADHNYFHNEYRHSHRDQQDTEPYQTWSRRNEIDFPDMIEPCQKISLFSEAFH
ncbi:hypothetical protein H8356DRAFT_1326468 [Neocallimastix lanati (nom. inval.)]|nr:hypothetical protein H8356DRAFT_1326468 [Neocallimastix sp. JGI-2020a]